MLWQEFDAGTRLAPATDGLPDGALQPVLVVDALLAVDTCTAGAASGGQEDTHSPARQPCTSRATRPGRSRNPLRSGRIMRRAPFSLKSAPLSYLLALLNVGDGGDAGDEAELGMVVDHKLTVWQEAVVGLVGQAAAVGAQRLKVRVNLNF